jgi:hypothetical protein
MSGRGPSNDEKRYWLVKTIAEGVKLAVWIAWTTLVKR